MSLIGLSKEQAVKQATQFMGWLPFRYHFIYEISPDVWIVDNGKTKAKMQNQAKKGCKVLQLTKGN